MEMKTSTSIIITEYNTFW